MRQVELGKMAAVEMGNSIPRFKAAQIQRVMPIGSDPSKIVIFAESEMQGRA
jgi:hypothetical protein